jgi:hypothetical protein
MTIKELHRLQKQMTSGKGVAKAADVDALVKAAQAELNPEAQAFMRDLLARKGEFFDDVAYKKIAELVGVAARPVLAAGVTAKLVRGGIARSLDDDKVILGADGTMSATAAINPYVRGYNQKSLEPLKKNHGSEPARSIVARGENDAHRASPGQRLDRIAEVFGAKVSGFEKMATSEWYSNPKAPHWWGTCDAWSWSSLSRWVNERVDVGGPVDQRGLWSGGQWISRADLGCWMMALADTIAVRENGIFFEEEPRPESILKSALAFLDNNGGGLVAEVWNDKRERKKEVWNQPFSGAEVITETLESRATTAMLEFAQADGVVGATQVKVVKVRGEYAVEVGEDFEDKLKNSQHKVWNMYAVTAANGEVLKAYFADDPAIANVRGLPVHESDATPDYVWKPTLDFIYDALFEDENMSIDNNPVGKEYRFFVKTVLAQGVPGHVRAAFENEVLATQGAIAAERLKLLEQAYPGIANAYSPEQWEKTFAPRGMSAKGFGAAWP